MNRFFIKIYMSNSFTRKDILHRFTLASLSNTFLATNLICISMTRLVNEASMPDFALSTKLNNLIEIKCKLSLN